MSKDEIHFKAVEEANTCTLFMFGSSYSRLDKDCAEYWSTTYHKTMLSLTIQKVKQEVLLK